jgi:hypothetical protein
MILKKTMQTPRTEIFSTVSLLIRAVSYKKNALDRNSLTAKFILHYLMILLSVNCIVMNVHDVDRKKRQLCTEQNCTMCKNVIPSSR